MGRKIRSAKLMKFTQLITLGLCAICLLASNALGQGRQGAIRDEVSFDQDVQPVLKSFCTTCHAGEEPEAEMSLTNYLEVKKHFQNGKVLERINDSDDPMPPSGLMPKYARRMLKTWADNGYVEKGKPRKRNKVGAAVDYSKFAAPKIEPVDINKGGFDLLENMQGHWVGDMNLMGQKFDWMAFDFRAIAPSHVHGIFEGGTIGNLFTSFFVTNFKGKRTIMARNGGILNGIYRTSYFVLDQYEKKKNSAGQTVRKYRLVDAYGGKDIMYMELEFVGEKIKFNAYTSRFGMTGPASAHMKFKGKRMHPELARQAAKKVGFPKNVVAHDFSKGLPSPDWGTNSKYITSASFLWEEKGLSLIDLGKRAKDPIRIDQMPYLSKLKVDIKRSPETKGKKLSLYLSRKALTDAQGKFITEYGYIKEDLLNGLLMFPEVSKTTNEFTFTYLHPGEYYLTVVADMNGDGFPSPGDITHPLKKVIVKPKSKQTIVIEKLNVKN